MKILLTSEESQELIERGIETNSWEPINPRGIGGQVLMGHPIFWISDLLKILPPAIRDYGGLEFGFDVRDGVLVSGYEFLREIFRGEELIDSLYKLILYLYEKDKTILGLS